MRHAYTHTRAAPTSDVSEGAVLCLTQVGACRLGCGPINELRLLALEDAERHGKLEALYHRCGFRNTGAARFECDTDHTYRHVPMSKALEPLVFVCVPRSLAQDTEVLAPPSEESEARPWLLAASIALPTPWRAGSSR